MGFGRRGPAQGGFGRKVNGTSPSSPRSFGTIFGNRATAQDSSPFEQFFERLERERHVKSGHMYEAYGTSQAMRDLSPHERGELLSDLVDRAGIHDGHNSSHDRDRAAYNAYYSIWGLEIEVQKEHLGAVLALMLGDASLRKDSYSNTRFDHMLRLIDSAIKQGGYLSSNDCEAIAEMASAIRGAQRKYSKADTKKMIVRAEKLEKLAGTTISATEFLMARCEGADNPWAIVADARPNAQFWADLLAETTLGLEDIRSATKGGSKPDWMRDASAFEAVWPSVGDVAPRFAAWQAGNDKLATLSQHNGKRSGFADPQAYRSLPDTIALAAAHSHYEWRSDQIPGLEVLADLEDPNWTALVEHLITQRRATRATAAWQKQALALCRALGPDIVEARLHDWLALFHTPVLDSSVYTQLCNGERFASAVEQLEESHPEWPQHHAGETRALGRAISMVVTSEATHSLCGVFRTQLIRLDDHVYKNTRATEGVLGLPSARQKAAEGRSSYDGALHTTMRVSVENEEFLRGVVWLLAVMPDRARAITALADVAQTAATYLSIGDEGMRSKIVANAAIATLIGMGGSDIDRSVLRLSKTIENCTINPPLFKRLNGAG